ncbi:unnamed protein product [Urochloa humidicola]
MFFLYFLRHELLVLYSLAAAGKQIHWCCMLLGGVVRIKTLFGIKMTLVFTIRCNLKQFYKVMLTSSKL